MRCRTCGTENPGRIEGESCIVCGRSLPGCDRWSISCWRQLPDGRSIPVAGDLPSSTGAELAKAMTTELRAWAMLEWNRDGRVIAHDDVLNRSLVYQPGRRTWIWLFP